MISNRDRLPPVADDVRLEYLIEIQSRLGQAVPELP